MSDSAKPGARAEGAAGGDATEPVTGRGHGEVEAEDDRRPPRGRLAPEVERAACAIHTKVWGDPYRSCEGPMHWAGGPYWHDELLRQADRWECLAAAARICAETLPDA